MLPIARFVANGFHRSLQTLTLCLVTTTVLGGILAVFKWKLKVPSSSDTNLTFEEIPVADLQSLGVR
jgi:hypothetical protein